MPLIGFIAAPRALEEPGGMMRKGVRLALVAVGLLIMLASIPLVLLFHTPGLIVLAVGLVVVLRNSFGARRIFIKAQRRHPKIVFPIRRLIRREPEIAPVFWHQTLRLERLILPRRFRVLRRTRLAVMRRRR